MRKLLLFAILVFCLSGCVSPQAPASELSENREEQMAPASEEPTEESIPQLEEKEDPIMKRLQEMTLEEKVGQLFLARCPQMDAQRQIRTYAPGGYVLFGADFENQTVESVWSTISGYQSVSRIPMLIAADEEGGSVCRVSAQRAFRSSPFRSPREYYAAGGMESALEAEQEKAIMLKGIGVNVNLAPVCDLAFGRNSFMYRRSLGQSPQVSAEFVSGAVKTMQSFDVGAVLKHFPGYGENGDTHTGDAWDRRSLEELAQNDFVPFLAGMDSGAGAVMIGHIHSAALDEELPASLSPKVCAYLRKEMGFSGVIMTDDLSMAAIAGNYDCGESAILAFLAGNDMLMTSDFEEQYHAVLEAVQTGRIPMERLDDSVLRILQWKQMLHL